MTAFKKIAATAAKRHGGEAAMKKLMPKPASAKALKAMSDDRYLSRMSFRVFATGLKHSMVEGKWPAFEEVFHGFDPRRVRAMSDEDLEALLNEPRIIRHLGKIRATHANAAAMCEIADEHGSFGAWLAAWPGDDIVGLWDTIQKRFSHMGGISGPYFLRMVGKDTFIFSKDVVKALNKWDVVEGEPKGNKARAEMQDVFNGWAAETGRPLSELSRILALSVD